LLKANDARAALIASQDAIALNDKRWEAYVTAAGAYSSQNLFDDAIGMLQAALARAPEDRKPLIRDALATTRQAASAPPLQAAATAPAPSPAPATATPTQAEIVLWKSIERSNSAADFLAYLTAYPNGVYAPLARSRASAISEAVRNLASVGQITEIQRALQYVIFDVAPGSRVAVGDTVLVKVRGEEMLEMTVQRRYESAASATGRGSLNAINVGASVFKREGSR
jgi:tetratricopeptide (TPR) repeat protein